VSPEQVAAEPTRVNETVPDYGGTPETSMGETAGTIGAAVAPYAAPVAIGAAGLGTAAGLYKFGSKALDVGRGISEQMNQRNVIEAAKEARMANRPGFGGTPRPPVPTPTAAPPAMTPPTMAPPAPPAAPPAAPQTPSVMQRGMDYARQMQKVAADKVMQGARAAAPYAKTAGVGLTAALTPGNAGQNYPVPQKGPYRGMEINPMTGRPWTPQELAQINR
jgi:hypothetical protein